MNIKFLSTILAACAFLPISAQDVDYVTPTQLVGDFVYERVSYSILDEENHTVTTTPFTDFNKYELAIVKVQDPSNPYNIYEWKALREIGTENYFYAPNQNLSDGIKIPEKVYDSQNTEYTVVEIGDYSFAYSSLNSQLRIEEFSPAIKRIGKGAFVNSLIGWIAFPENSALEIIDDEAFKDLEQFQGASDGNNNFVIPNSVTTIGESAFEGCGFQYVKLPDNLTSLGNSAFKNCTKLQGEKTQNNTFILTIPGVQKIGDYAFYNCFNINNLVLSDGILKIGVSAFENCNALGNNMSGYRLKMPESLNSIGNRAFFIEQAREGIKAIELSNVKSIGDEAFCKWNNIDSLTIPKTVTYLGSKAFEDCSGFRTLIIEDGDELFDINPHAFGRTGVVSVTLGNRVEHVLDSAFHDCKELATVDFGETVKSLGDYAFGMTGYYGKDVSAKLQEVRLPDSCTKLGKGCFKGGVSNAGNIILGKNTESIGDSAFFNCKIYNLTLPATLKEIGDNAFNLQDSHTNNPNETGENYLKDIYIYAAVPPTIQKETWGVLDEEVNNTARFFWIYRTVCLHVPQESYLEYKTHSLWGQFQCIIGDLVDTGKESLGSILTYVFTVPGETTYIKDIIDKPENQEWVWDYLANSDKYGNKDIKKDENQNSGNTPVDDRFTTPYEDTNCVGDNCQNLNHIFGLGKDDIDGEFIYGNHYGQDILIAYRDDENIFTKDDGTEYEMGHTYAAAIIVFVCPTITVGYQTDKPSGDERQQVSVRKAPLVTYDGDAETTTTTTSNKDSATDEYVTYEHRVVYNSLPKMNVETSEYLTNITIQRGEFDESGNALITNDENGMTELDKAVQFIDNSYIVPVDPITNSRVLLFDAEPDTTNDGGNVSGVDPVEVSDSISVAVSGNTVSVIGAEPADVVKVYDINGQLVYNSVIKDFQIFKSGVYVATVADAVFKITVR